MVDGLYRGHEALRSKYGSDERAFLERLASDGQSPSALYVGCSDSRVVPEILTSSSPGDLFVVRNVANLVPKLEHADASVGAALEYAIGHLHVPHLIVCGHYGCGGVKAVLDELSQVQDLPSLKEWLTPILSIASVAKAEGLEGDALWRRAVEENVLLQLENLLTFPCVADAHAAGKLELHGWAYDLFALELLAFEHTEGKFRPATRLLEPTT